MRLAVLLAALCWGLVPTPGAAEVCITDRQVRFTVCLHDTTDRYGHKVLGRYGEYAALSAYALDPDTSKRHLAARLVLPNDRVFEDVAPRLGDLTADGWPEIVTVVSTEAAGAALTVFALPRGPAKRPLDETTPVLAQVAATPPIGRRNRWLAPSAIADLDGDGQKDVAYVDRPHLAGVLRVWTLRCGELVQLASASGFSNHRIGQDFITGGVRDCGQGPELILPHFNGSQTMLVRLANGGLFAKTVANRADRATIEKLLHCNKV